MLWWQLPKHRKWAGLHLQDATVLQLPLADSELAAAVAGRPDLRAVSGTKVPMYLELQAQLGQGTAWAAQVMKRPLSFWCQDACSIVCEVAAGLCVTAPSVGCFTTLLVAH